MSDPVIQSGRRRHGYLIVAALLFCVCCATRLIGLGTKALMHDESLFLYYSYFTIHKSLIYDYQPILHGPASLWILAGLFRIFGDHDWVVRLGSGLLGIGGFFWVAALRPWLGRGGTLVALGFYTASTSLMYYQRFLRIDELFVFTTLWIVAAGAWWWRMRSPGWLASFIMANVVLFCNKESSVFIYFTLATFAVLLILYDVASSLTGPPRRLSPVPAAPLPSPVFVGGLIFASVFLFITRVLEGIAFDQDVIDAIGHDCVWKDVRSIPLALGWLPPVANAGLLGSPIFWRVFYVGLFAGSLSCGVLLRRAVERRWGRDAMIARWWEGVWNGKWALLAALGGGLFLYQFLFTSAFHFPRGPFETYKATLAYWSGQHEMHRLRGPFHMHIVNMLVYELPEVLLVLGAWLFAAARGGWRRTTAISLGLIASAFLFFHLWVFRGLANPMLYFLFLALVALPFAITLFIWPRAGRWAAIALLPCFVIFSYGYFHSQGWISFAASPAVRSGKVLSATGRELLDKTLSLEHAFHLFLIAFLIVFGTVATWRAIEDGRRFRAFSFWWLITMTGAASYAREKVPWVGIHIAPPLIVLAGSYAQQLLEWARARSGPRRTIALAAWGLFFGIGITWNLFSAYRACFVHPGSVRERISSYSESPLDLKLHGDAIRELVRKGETNGLLVGLRPFARDDNPFEPEWTVRHPGIVQTNEKIRVLISNEDVTWPMRWYLRDIEWQETNVLESKLAEDWPIILIRDWDADKPAVAEKYEFVRGRARMYWLSEPADYEHLFGKAAVAEWRKLWRYYAWREIEMDPPPQTSVVEYYLGVRKDLIMSGARGS